MYPIPNIILPLPDELFGSFIERLASFNGCSPYELLECYAGISNSSAQSTYTMDSCEHPERLIKALDLDCSVLDFLSQTSILPALYPLMTPLMQDKTFHQITGEHRLLGRLTPLVMDTYYCPSCQQEDIDTYGVAYIHRSHCLPGIKCCHKHHIPLINCKSGKTTTTYVTDVDIKYANFFANFLSHWINTNYQDLYEALVPLIKVAHDLGELPEATYNSYFKNGLKEFTRRLAPKSTYIAYPSLVMLIMLLFDSFEDFNNYITNYIATEPPLIEHTCSDCHTVYFDTPHAISMGWLCPHCSKDMTDTEYVSRYVSSCTNDEYQLIGSFDGMMKPLSLYHKKCGETIPIRARSFIHQGARCDCEHYNTFDSISKNLPDNFELLHFTGNTNDPIIVKSADCGHVFPAHYHKLIKYPGCKECQKQYASENGYKKSVQDLVGDEYTLESTYQNRTQKVQMLHTICNTCFPIAPKHFLSGQRCPVCTSQLKDGDFVDYVSKLSSGRYVITDTLLWWKGVSIYDTETDTTRKMPSELILQELKRPTPSTLLPHKKIDTLPPCLYSYRSRVLNFVFTKLKPNTPFKLSDIALDDVPRHEIKRSIAYLIDNNVLTRLKRGVYIFKKQEVKNT